jgi:hypothetical protein
LSTFSSQLVRAHRLYPGYKYKGWSDKRVYELLNEKFKLFDGVFGASDEILGSILNLEWTLNGATLDSIFPGSNFNTVEERF